MVGSSSKMHFDEFLSFYFTTKFKKIESFDFFIFPKNYFLTTCSKSLKKATHLLKIQFFVIFRKNRNFRNFPKFQKSQNFDFFMFWGRRVGRSPFNSVFTRWRLGAESGMTEMVTVASGLLGSGCARRAPPVTRTCGGGFET